MYKSSTIIHTLIHTSFPKASVHVLNQITSMISFICLGHSQVQCHHSFMHCGVCRCMCTCVPMCVCVYVCACACVYMLKHVVLGLSVCFAINNPFEHQILKQIL